MLQHLFHIKTLLQPKHQNKTKIYQITLLICLFLRIVVQLVLSLGVMGWGRGVTPLPSPLPEISEDLIYAVCIREEHCQKNLKTMADTIELVQYLP
jgi:hypothetical protein